MGNFVQNLGIIAANAQRKQMIKLQQEQLAELRRQQGGGPISYQHHAVSVGWVPPVKPKSVIPDVVAGVLTLGLSIPFSIYRHRRNR